MTIAGKHVIHGMYLPEAVGQISNISCDHSLHKNINKQKMVTWW